MKYAVLLIMALILLVTISLARPPAAVRATALKAEDDFQLVKVAEGVYAAIAKPGGLASGNAGFVVGDGGVLVFDTFFTRRTHRRDRD